MLSAYGVLFSVLYLWSVLHLELLTPARRSSAPRYDTCLLTCWQERDEVGGTVTWRFSLETPQSGRRRLFVTLKEAMKTIEKELETPHSGRQR